MFANIDGYSTEKELPVCLFWRNAMFGQDLIVKLSRQDSIKTKGNDETNSLGKMSSGRKWLKSEKLSSLRMGMEE